MSDFQFYLTAWKVGKEPQFVKEIGLKLYGKSRRMLSPYLNNYSMSYIHDGEKQEGTCWFVVYEISQIQQKLNTNLTTYIWFT